ncbi:hypothetical protein Tco_0921866, partial [Tanacetum coccineum]
PDPYSAATHFGGVTFYTKDGDEVDYEFTKDHDEKCVVVGYNDPRMYQVMAIEEPKDLTSLSLDELIRNLKVHEMIIKKDSKIVKAKGERKSLALKAKKESSDEEYLTSGSKDEEYAMPVRDFKKFFKRIEVLGVIAVKDEKKVKDETCLLAQPSSEICLGVDLEPDEWIKNNGCSKHMTGNQKLFSSYKAYKKGNVIFGSNLHGNIIGKGTISNDSLKIDETDRTKIEN